jgi:TPR repeat protein
MYFNAEGVEKDGGMAFYWMRIGAGENHARARAKTRTKLCGGRPEPPRRATRKPTRPSPR